MRTRINGQASRPRSGGDDLRSQCDEVEDACTSDRRGNRSRASSLQRHQATGMVIYAMPPVTSSVQRGPTRTPTRHLVGDGGALFGRRIMLFSATSDLCERSGYLRRGARSPRRRDRYAHKVTRPSRRGVRSPRRVCQVISPGMPDSLVVRFSRLIVAHDRLGLPSPLLSILTAKRCGESRVGFSPSCAFRFGTRL